MPGDGGELGGMCEFQIDRYIVVKQLITSSVFS